MKYMGSKSALLNGELGEILLSKAGSAHRFVDLFSGSGAVSTYVAESAPIEVVAVDLQNYSRFLAAAVIERTLPLDANVVLQNWVLKAIECYEADPRRGPLERASDTFTLESIADARSLCEALVELPIVRSYGGHYFSPGQSLALDHLLAARPNDASFNLATASVIRVASRVAAAPGHTAQPFQPSEKLSPFIKRSWSMNVFEETARQVIRLAPRAARVTGRAVTGDAIDFARDLNEGDLVFCDPPYSSAQYSRFYHVLEGVAKGGWPSISGRGRAPVRLDRATSHFSMKRRSLKAIQDLFTALANTGCSVVMTFPAERASNGLSGNLVIAEGRKLFNVEIQTVSHTHSTLGGANGQSARGSRRAVRELVLFMTP